MKLGVIFPQTEIGSDPGAIREFAQAAEELGYHHILVYDHVLGADPDKHPDWGGAYTMHSAFHEPFVLFGYLAGLTSTINLTTGIIILPQRQTVLVAKQAAAIDVLSNGRMRLGVGLGWNRVEYEALGEDFRTRGRRVEEQVALLRALWTDESVDFSGNTTRSTARASTQCPCSGQSPSGWAAEPSRCCAEWARWPTVGFHNFSPTRRAVSSWSGCGTSPAKLAETLPTSRSARAPTPPARPRTSGRRPLRRGRKRARRSSTP